MLQKLASGTNTGEQVSKSVFQDALLRRHFRIYWLAMRVRILSIGVTVNLGQCGRNQDDVHLTSGLQNKRFSGNVVTILLHPKPSYWLETP